MFLSYLLRNEADSDGLAHVFLLKFGCSDFRALYKCCIIILLYHDIKVKKLHLSK